ncbi:NADH-quinone oxidoreductase subunit L [Intrasporangium calvum]|uniref:NADH dehydrogenase subunit L n=1 Tax=Intrasporangium calvum (strain ATCC 23552 / DSM 43043 / JCM 3097 / NBRC 12989 / NCIMB 10167 / NRRL B-3866 / 7 KIP) TaxID=710696 RepID=E6SAJ1_INTC7|nr:NADH-quinone oxidoreductase subunit L [Intrasporangium calvum]ADU47241.1 NADH dehydrogenase subunit L [Intrasporangium calvum DSM 43043]
MSLGMGNLLAAPGSYAAGLAAQSGEAHAASGITSVAWLLIALPLLGAAVLLLGGRRTNSFGPLLATALSWGSFLVGALVLIQMLGQDAEERHASVPLFDFVTAGSFSVDASLLVDQLSIAFVLLITFVGSLIHVYSLGYMEHDPDKRRFFAYLNLFVAAMLLLVLADNYLLLYVGWEGVGLASYLLIGFWNWNPAYATAANKAFVANRVGDFGLSVAVMIMFFQFGAVDFSTVLGAAGNEANQGFMTALGLMLLLGATGKSAQFPLQSWLGDAMAGPTPVSALIHAATMVTAGVYLVVRSGPIFEASPNAQLAVVVVGAITLLFGAIVGTAKDDIKKALAASTMSQIGYMMLAAGLGPVGYAFAIFHLLTHGFFKAGMFLGAGSVMHGMNDQVNMRRFGGLSGLMKVTWATFALGWLAIIGVPPFSGFWSKDKIIEAAFIGEGWRPWVFGGAALIGAGITAFYMSRLFFLTFHGKKRWTDDVHPHESGLLMTVPMMVLAVGSAFLGLIIGPTGMFSTWLEPVTGAHGEEHPVLAVPVIMVLTLLLVAGGVALAWMQYWRDDVPVIAPAGNLLTQAARNDLYQDQVNEALLMRPGIHLTRSLVFVDGKGVDGGAGGLAALVGGTSSRLRRIQNGFARSYALTMLTGVVAILGALWVIS